MLHCWCQFLCIYIYTWKVYDNLCPHDIFTFLQETGRLTFRQTSSNIAKVFTENRIYTFIVQIRIVQTEYFSIFVQLKFNLYVSATTAYIELKMKSVNIRYSSQKSFLWYILTFIFVQTSCLHNTEDSRNCTYLSRPVENLKCHFFTLQCVHVRRTTTTNRSALSLVER